MRCDSLVSSYLSQAGYWIIKYNSVIWLFIDYWMAILFYFIGFVNEVIYYNLKAHIWSYNALLIIFI